MSKEINVALATDVGYLKQTIVAIESVMMNGTAYNTYHFYILTDKETEGVFCFYKERICERYSNCIMDCVIMADIFENVDIHIEHITKPTYYRLLLPNLIDCERCIYLDSDVIVCDDLADMYNMEMGDNEIAGVVAPSLHKFPENGREYVQKTGIPSMEHYVNTGVLLMHLANMREHGFCDKIDSLLNKQFPMQDQDIINIASYGYIKLLPFKYNYQAVCLTWKKERYEGVITDNELQESPYIIHYSTIEKPWEFFDNVYADRWWDICRKSIVYQEFYEQYKNLFYYYGIVKNKRLWQLEKYTEQWLGEIRKYNNIYVYGAGVKGKKTIEYLLKNNITVKAILVSSMDNNEEYIQGIKVECLSSQLSDDDLIILALRSDYVCKVRRKLFKMNILNLLNVEEI